MGRIWCLVVLTAVGVACARPSDTTQIDGEIAKLQQDINSQEVSVAKLTSGSPLWTLASLHLDTDKQTVAMLKQKRASLLYYVELSYTVDGTVYRPPSNQA